MDKVIFWDYDGTLVYFLTMRMQDALSEVLCRAGYSVTREELNDILLAHLPMVHPERTYVGEPSRWWTVVFEGVAPFYRALGVREEEEARINAAFHHRVTAVNDYTLYADAISTLRACAERGYRNYILSNNYPELSYFIEDLGLAPYFSGVITSGNVGYEKPRPELFAHAKRVAGCESGFMVGDNPVSDMAGGKRAGLTTVLVHNDTPCADADYTCATLSEILSILP